jgi:hypothetical protein
MQMLRLSPRIFEPNAKIDDDRFVQVFGTIPLVISHIWNYLKPFETMARNVQPIHILWGFILLKTYGTESANSSLAGGVDKDTFRTWAWSFIQAMAEMETYLVRNILFMVRNNE